MWSDLGYGLRLRDGVGMRGGLQAVRRWSGRYVSRLIDALLAGSTWWRMGWQGLSAVGLIALYALFLLFASVCLATGLHHPDTHQHAPHQHHGDDTDYPTSLLDPCDCALRALTTSETHAPSLLPVVLLPGQALTPRITTLVSAEPPIFHTIRAPPFSLS
jgi:hypothetical protein